VETLIAWSKINSGSSNVSGVNKMADAICQYVKARIGCKIKTVAMLKVQDISLTGNPISKPVGDALILEKHSQTAHIKILLCGHLDTVFDKEHEFQHPTKIDEDTLQGPGVTDMKGGILVMLSALEIFEKTPLAKNIAWKVILTPDEEIGSLASRELLETSAKDYDLALVYEPSVTTDGVFAKARNGSGNFTVVVHGKSVHAGREFHKGGNAITAASQAITQLNAINYLDDKQITINIAQIQAATALNIVPDKAVFKFNVRFRNDEESLWLQQHIDEIISNINALPNISASLHGGFTRPAKPLTPNTEKLFECLKTVAKQLNLDIKLQDTGGCCDGNNLQAYGLPTIDTLGVRGANIHSNKEYIILPSLIERTKLSAVLLLYLANNKNMFNSC
ncbi:MAG: hypothetical protein COB50_03520, partial [Thiotrichales bacterium]